MTELLTSDEYMLKPHPSSVLLMLCPPDEKNIALISWIEGS